MPPLKDVISPTGKVIRASADVIRSIARDLELCRQYRERALATPLSATWDAQDRDSYLYYLDGVEAGLMKLAAS